MACVKHWAKRRAVNDPYRCVAFFFLFSPLRGEYFRGEKNMKKKAHFFPLPSFPSRPFSLAKKKKKNSGTLSSYAYVLMCVHLLQTRRPHPALPVLQSEREAQRDGLGFDVDVPGGVAGSTLSAPPARRRPRPPSAAGPDPPRLHLLRRTEGAASSAGASATATTRPASRGLLAQPRVAERAAVCLLRVLELAPRLRELGRVREDRAAG